MHLATDEPAHRASDFDGDYPEAAQGDDTDDGHPCELVPLHPVHRVGQAFEQRAHDLVARVVSDTDSICSHGRDRFPWCANLLPRDASRTPRLRAQELQSARGDVRGVFTDSSEKRGAHAVLITHAEEREAWRVGGEAALVHRIAVEAEHR